MEGKNNWWGSMVTRRATVMTPLLVLNAVVGSAAIAALLFRGEYYVFAAWLLLLGYTIYRHERWANNAPWLLAPQQIALAGLKLFGTSKKQVDSVVGLESVDNPQNKSLSEGNGKAEKV